MTTAQIEDIWNAADSAISNDPESVAAVVTHRGNLGWLASGRYTTRSAAFRAQRTIMARDDTNSYVVTRGRSDDYVIWLDKDITL